MTSPDEILGGRAELVWEERKYRPCAGFDCKKVLPGDAPSRQKFCSLKCGHRHRATIRRRPVSVKKCAWCHKSFIPRQGQKYHSDDCAKAAARRRSRKWRKANLNKHRQSVREYAAYVRRQRAKRWRKERQCQWCDEAFMPRHPRQVYCSPEHRYEAFRRQQHERYHGDPEYRRAHLARHARWQKENRERVNELNRASKQRKRGAA